MYLPQIAVHEFPIIRGMTSPPKYGDPTRRLGIKVSGLRAADQVENFHWVRKYVNRDQWIPQINRLVDWLEGRDLDEIRPRRFYPCVRGEKPGLYTRHPADVDDWQKKLT